jgi:RNA polymerase sigma-70 factor (ECF subfamily)
MLSISSVRRRLDLAAMAVERRDDEAFRALIEPHRPAVRLHCYRLLGSLQDAEDLTQETLLRAWRGLDRFEGRASTRAWLHRIATNACLDEIDRRGRRILPVMQGAPRTTFTAGPPVPSDTPWLDPMPDTWFDLADTEPGPEARYEAKESIQLAFIAALQQLPGRQRAVLLLCDVLGWSAPEVAEMLETTVTATHSALQRARSSIGRPSDARSTQLSPAAEHDLVERYVGAWERGDVEALVLLLKDDARLSMPPLPEWYIGIPAIADFFRWATSAEGPGPYRLVRRRANGSPAFEVYAREQPFLLQVAEVDEAGIVAMTSFMKPELFAFFG